MKYLAVLLLLSASLFADTLKIEVVAVHSVTRSDEGARGIADRALVGTHSTRTRESFNIDSIIDGKHVVLMCEDSKGCEAPAIGTYSAELKRGKFVHMNFPIPLSEKNVTRWYKVAGTW